MAHSDKNIVITPNIGSTTADPQIVFSGANASLGPQNITLRTYATSNGTLSFEGSAGQLFSITNTMSGVIFSVNDVSGIPSIEVLDSGLIKLAQYSGRILLGTSVDNGVDKLQVTGSITITGTVKLPTVGTSGFVKLGAGGQLSADTSTYITAEADTLSTVTGRGASTSTRVTLSGGATITNADIRSAATSGWTGDPGAEGKIQYHSNRWYIVADQSSDRIVQFRRNGTDVSYIDNSGNFIGNASTATTATSADQIDGQPFRNTNSNSAVDANTLESNGITYYSAGVDNFTGNSTDGALYSHIYSSSWQHQIAGDFREGNIAVRGKNSGTWARWKTIPTIAISDSAPANETPGDMWWESDTGKLKIYYNDGSSSQWVDASPIPDLTTYYSKAGGAISGPVVCQSSLTTNVLTTGGVGVSGTVTGSWTLTTGSTWQATFADLAEWYTSDYDYEYGTVMVFGGEFETTISTAANDKRVAGVISKDPAFIMNVDQPGPSSCVALQGRLPVKVTGIVKKGDLLVTSAIPGVAMTNNDAAPYTVIGKAIENKDTAEQGLVLVSVGR